MLRIKENPAGGPGLKENTRCADREERTLNSLVGQGFCGPCAYSRAVRLDSGRVRRLCTLLGIRVGVYGVPWCEFMEPKGGAA